MLPFQLIEYSADGGGLPVRQLEDEFLPAVSLRQRQQDMVGLGFADDQIHLPVSALRPLPDVCWSVLYAGQFWVCDALFSIVLLLLLFALVPEVLVGQCQKDPLIYVAIQSADTDAGLKAVLPCRRQGCRRGVPVHDDLMLEEAA